MLQKVREKNYHTCEYCKIKPCMYELKGEVEYRTHCRHYKPNTAMIRKEKGR